MRTVIFKVGGSLFDLRDLGPRLQRLFGNYDLGQVLVFPGGGEAADVVRNWHERFVLTEEQSHWLAIQSLDLNGHLLSELLPKSRWTIDPVMFRDHQKHDRVSVLLPRLYLWRLEFDSLPDSPPHVWDVTSDTLAAWTAIHWPADELLLVKSVPCPAGKTAVEAVQAGLVDAYFPGYAGRLPHVSWCYLRDAAPRVTPWLEHGRPVTEA